VIEYDFYDYLQFLLEDRLFQKERSPYKVIGTVRIFQARVKLECDDNFGDTCDMVCYKVLRSEHCNLLYEDADEAQDYQAPQTCAFPDCSEYTEINDSDIPTYEGQFGKYDGGKGYIAEFYYSMDYGAIVNQLKANDWIDVDTRAVLLRFTVYNFWIRRYLSVEATIETPSPNNIHGSFYINSISLVDSDNGVLYFCILVLVFNTIFFIGKIIFELSIGLSIFTNLLEMVDCFLTFAL